MYFRLTFFVHFNCLAKSDVIFTIRVFPSGNHTLTHPRGTSSAYTGKVILSSNSSSSIGATFIPSLLHVQLQELHIHVLGFERKVVLSISAKKPVEGSSFHLVLPFQSSRSSIVIFSIMPLVYTSMQQQFLHKLRSPAR